MTSPVPSASSEGNAKLPNVDTKLSTPTTSNPEIIKENSLTQNVFKSIFQQTNKTLKQIHADSESSILSKSFKINRTIRGGVDFSIMVCLKRVFSSREKYEKYKELPLNTFINALYAKQLTKQKSPDELQEKSKAIHKEIYETPLKKDLPKTSSESERLEQKIMQFEKRGNLKKLQKTVIEIRKLEIDLEMEDNPDKAAQLEIKMKDLISFAEEHIKKLEEK